MKKRFLVLTSFGLGLSGLLFSTLTHAQAPQPNNNGSGNRTEPANSYPVNERRAFINSCAAEQSATFQVVCGCTFDKIRVNIPYSQYREIARRLRAGEDLPQNILNFINECIDTPEA